MVPVLKMKVILAAAVLSLVPALAPATNLTNVPMQGGMGAANGFV
jgi:hypothetical protein